MENGTIINQYKIISAIGKGGMGEVFLAQDTKLNRKVALKILPPEFAEDLDRMSRFVREAQSASALNHPNIITIHEIGESDGTHFIATEFIDGKTLGDYAKMNPLNCKSALEIAIQIASALDEAHSAGIVHRDIKPDNVMIRSNGLAKILDFGIAKLSASSTSVSDSSEDATAIKGGTSPGMIIGTANYMSPEQAKGQAVDARSDIFSLGVVLYEMLSGQRPFAGENAMDVIGAILHKEPMPINQILPDLPTEIKAIVNKTLRKECDERYQTAQNLLIELKEARRELEFRDKFGVSPGEGRQPLESITQTFDRAPTGGEGFSNVAIPTATSSAEFIITQIKTHKRRLALAVIPVVVVAAALSAFFYFKPGQTPKLTDKDAILLADFDNRTGDAVFDGTLKQGLAVILGQSPFLDIFPDSRVRETLASMEHKPDERVTESIAREICLRQGLKAFLSGAITSLGSNYVITLKAVNAQTGDEMASEQVEAESKEQVLKTISQAAIRLREKLGESLSSIQKFDAPVEQATTASLDALKAYSLGLEQSNGGNYSKAIPFYQRAVELDPNFAIGYLALARNQLNSGLNNEAVLSAGKAFELRERATENEKLYITLLYHRVVTNDVEKAIEVGEVWKQTYPHFWRPYHALADLYIDVGQFEKSVENGREAMRLNPRVAAAYSNPAGALMYLNRFAEAKEIYKEAMANKLDAPEYHTYLYWIAYFEGDGAEMSGQLKWHDANNYPYWSLALQSQTAALDGKWSKTKDLTNRAAEILMRAGTKGYLARIVSRDAVTGAVFGDCRTGRIKAELALSLVPDATFSESVAALALCGAVSEAQAHTAKLTPLYPHDTRFNGILLPVIRAAVELQRGQPAAAIQSLETARPYEANANFLPQYLRGMSYLRLGKGAEAAAEFQKIIDRRGQADFFVSTLYPLAHLGLARSAAVSGDTALARRSYEDFFTLWKDADTDLPILIEAKKEYGKLR